MKWEAEVTNAEDTQKASEDFEKETKNSTETKSSDITNQTEGKAQVESDKIAVKGEQATAPRPARPGSPGEAAQAAGGARPSSGQDAAEDIPSAGGRILPLNERGHTFRGLFQAFARGAAFVTVEEPHLSEQWQRDNFHDFVTFVSTMGADPHALHGGGDLPAARGGAGDGGRLRPLRGLPAPGLGGGARPALHFRPPQRWVRLAGAARLGTPLPPAAGLPGRAPRSRLAAHSAHLLVVVARTVGGRGGDAGAPHLSSR